MDSGRLLGPYEITGRLGAGGMGEVYRAIDTRLGRTVAIKILSPDLASDEAGKRRFRREARAISNLNHPNICGLHDIGEADGREFLVMEYLEGETLAERLSRGPLAYAEAMTYAVQIASALERAHREKIVHRDLKPGNVMLTRAGAKLLDFGLARTLESESSAAGPLTAEDSVIGTVDYMAPEQLSNGSLDERADLFSFGVLLYEMLTGARPFTGKNRASVIGAILFSDAPALTARDAALPPALERVVDACLKKDPDERLQTAHDLRLQLEWIRDGQVAAQPVPRGRWLPSRRVLAAAAILLAAFVGIGIAGAKLARNRAGEVRFTIEAPVQGESIDWAVISPDGTRIVLVSQSAAGARSLWVRDLASTVARPLNVSATMPFWSPDGRSLAYFSQDKLQVQALDGTRPQSVAAATAPRGGAWGSKGVILYSPDVGTGIWATDERGSNSREVTHLDAKQGDVTHRWPEFLPDGEHFIFVLRSRSVQRSGLYAASLDGRTLKKISTLQSHAVVAAGGALVFMKDRKLWRQEFDLRALELRGAPRAIAAGIEPDLRITGATRLSVSSEGTMVFASAADARRRVAWVSRDGRLLRTLTDPAHYIDPALSPDGRTLAISRVDEESGLNAIWLMDAQTGALTPFVDDESNAVAPVWSADGRRIFYSSDRRGPYEVYERAVGSVAADKLRIPSRTYAQALSSSRTATLFEASHPNGEATDFLLWPDGEPAPRPLLTVGGGGADLSRDGKWMAVRSVRSEGTRAGITVRPVGDPSRSVNVGPEGSLQPTWSRDGRELYYVDPRGQVIATEFHDGTLGAATPLFNVSLDSSASTRTFVPSADGKQFAVLLPPQNPARAAVTVVLNGNDK